MRTLLIVWLLVVLTLAGLVIVVAPWLPPVPEEEDEHGR